MSLLSNRLENFLLSIINWTRSSFVENEFFHVSSPIWYLTKSLKTLNEFNQVSVNSGSTATYEIYPLLDVYIICKLDLQYMY